MLRSFGLAGMMTLALMSSEANALDIVNDDPGGQIAGYTRRLALAEARGEPVRIGAVECDSSCTLFLAARRACVSPQAVFGFHAPWLGAPNAGVVSPELTELFARSYKPTLRRLFMAHVRSSGGVVPGPLMRLSGLQLASLGYRLCGDEDTRSITASARGRAPRYAAARRINPAALASSPRFPFDPWGR
jgi:hypothetical protein